MKTLVSAVALALLLTAGCGGRSGSSSGSTSAPTTASQASTGGPSGGSPTSGGVPTGGTGGVPTGGTGGVPTGGTGTGSSGTGSSGTGATGATGTGTSGTATSGPGTLVGPGPGVLTVASAPGPQAASVPAGARVPVVAFTATASGDPIVLSEVHLTSQASVDPSTLVTLVELVDANGQVVASAPYQPAVIQPPGVGAPNRLPQTSLTFQQTLPVGASASFTVYFTLATNAPSGATIAANPPGVSAQDASSANLWVTINSTAAGGPTITVQ